MTTPIFISFDRAEAIPYADALARFLGENGVPVWYEREIGGNEQWGRVAAEIQACAAVVLVMTPGAEQSPWVTSELNLARQSGKPVLALLLQGEPFGGIASYEDVRSGALPGPGFLTQVRGPATAFSPAQPVAKKSRTGLIIGLVAGGLALLLCGIAGVVLVAYTIADAPSQASTWQERAAEIDGIQNYLEDHPEWYEFDPVVGNHQRGRITYPISPPAGGTHNPVWQNCMGDVFDAEVATEHVMHSLEHGAVWVTYRPGLARDQVEALAKRVRDVPYTLMSPYPGQDRPISLQAWGYQLKVDNANDKRIDEFLSALRRNASQEPLATCGNGITDTGSAPLDFP